MTLVEILVAMAIAVAILGTMGGIYSATTRAVRRSTMQDRVFDEAASIATTIERHLKQFVPRIDQEQWTSSAIAFAASEGDDSPQTQHVRIWSEDDSQVAMEVRPSGDLQPVRSVIGFEKGQLQADVGFTFASDFQGLDPVWKDELAPGEHPRLVRYEVTVAMPEALQMRNAPVKQVKLSGAVALVD